MKTVWKFALGLSKVDDVSEIDMPIGAEVLSVGNQNENLCFWALVDPTAKKFTRRFLVVGTGNPFPSGKGKPNFIGTVQFMQGNFVVHVFEVF